jgi:hypothetical protein
VAEPGGTVTLTPAQTRDPDRGHRAQERFWRLLHLAD